MTDNRTDDQLWADALEAVRKCEATPQARWKSLPALV
jgi:hypothetical protein